MTEGDRLQDLCVNRQQTVSTTLGNGVRLAEVGTDGELLSAQHEPSHTC